MRQKRDIASLQLDAMSNYLAFVPRDRSLSLSAQIARDAAAGDVWARRVLQSRILENPQSAETPVDDLAAAALLPSIAVVAQSAAARKQPRDVARGVVIGVDVRRRRRSVGTPARRAAHAPLAIVG